MKYLIQLLLVFGVFNIGIAQDEAKIEDWKFAGFELHKTTIDFYIAPSSVPAVDRQKHLKKFRALDDDVEKIRPVLSDFRLLGSATATIFERDLELTAAQRSNLQNLYQATADRIAEFAPDYYEARDSKSKRNQLVRSFVSDLTKLQEDNSILSFQLKRLRQLDRQMLLRTNGFVKGLTDTTITKELRITDAQAKRIKSKGKEISDEFVQELEKIIEDSQEEMLSILTTEQRTKLETVTGPLSTILPVAINKKIFELWLRIQR